MSPRVLVVAGPAGSGKSTLGAALAQRLGAVLLDLDTLTNPLLDALDAFHPVGGPHGGDGGGAFGGDHWNAPAHRARVRPARYAALRAVATAQVTLGLDVVLVAPFTAELAGGREWEELCAAVAPVTPSVTWLDADPALLAARVTRRSLPRDAVLAPPAGPVVPVVAHMALAADLPTKLQVAQLLG